MNEFRFQAGGPLLAGSPVYVPRKADEKAAVHLRRMEYITMVEPREHGKTSLINRLVGQFSSLNYTFACRDMMAATPHAISHSDWYASLGRWLLRQLRLLPWEHRPELPTDSASWEDFLADVAETAEAAGQYIVIVLDEIGALPPDWATDFFSVIRSVYTSRQSLPFWQHLTFIIAGAFNPQELIQDDMVSNFNVDQRISLDDFTVGQVGQMVAHLHLPTDLAQAVSARVHHWTDGQPYLCQRLCLYLEEQREPVTVSAVDRAVDQFFQEDTHHLARIMELADELDLVAYAQRITGESRSRFNAAINDKHFRLAHIMGIIKADPGGWCKIRNRIYERALLEILKEKSKGGKTMQELPPEVKAQGALFLFDIGRWAATELKERWTLARKGREGEQPTEVDLAKPKEEVKEESEALLQDINAEHGRADVERVLALIERKRNLITEWKENTLDNEEEYNRQLITRATLRLRNQELGQKISQTLVEVETDLKELGVEVKKEQLPEAAD